NRVGRQRLQRVFHPVGDGRPVLLLHVGQRAQQEQDGGQRRSNPPLARLPAWQRQERKSEPGPKRALPQWQHVEAWDEKLPRPVRRNVQERHEERPRENEARTKGPKLRPTTCAHETPNGQQSRGVRKLAHEAPGKRPKLRQWPRHLALARELKRSILDAQKM